MTQPVPPQPARRQTLLAKALEEISIGDPEKAETYIQLALDEETAAPEMIEALEFVRMTFADIEASKRKGYSTECPKVVAAAIAKAKAVRHEQAPRQSP